VQIFKLNNINIHSFSIEELEKSLLEILSVSEEPKIITTFNIDFLRIIKNNTDFLNICNNSLWNLADGVGITSLVRLKYKQQIKRITGNDIFSILLKIANNSNYRVAIVGGSKEVSAIVRQKIQNQFNGLSANLICLSPQYLFEEDKNVNQDMIDRITTFEPEIVFAAMGCPRQEMWLSKNMQKFGSKINIGIGAVLDYYSGIKKRSPDLFQRFGFEWLWRLLNEPRRLFRRYILLDLPFFIQSVANVLQKKDENL